MKGTYSKEDIENRILALTNLMLDDSTYEFEMILKEIQQKDRGRDKSSVFYIQIKIKFLSYNISLIVLF